MKNRIKVQDILNHQWFSLTKKITTCIVAYQEFPPETEISMKILTSGLKINKIQKVTKSQFIYNLLVAHRPYRQNARDRFPLKVLKLQFPETETAMKKNPISGLKFNYLPEIPKSQVSKAPPHWL